MTESAKDREKQRREARLKIALRDNLRRRKAQARGRSAADAPAAGNDDARAAGTRGAPLDSAGFAADKRNR